MLQLGFELFQTDTIPLIVDKIEFHAGGNRTLKPTTVLSWTQKNNSDIKQKLSISKEKIITTENTYQFRWDTGAKISCKIGISYYDIYKMFA